jgi:hypothetical protein
MSKHEISYEVVGKAREKAGRFLLAHYETYKHFAIFEYYPSFETKKDKGWHYTFSSPFLHANVMYALLNGNFDLLDEILHKSVDFLLDFKEPGDLWRFWKVKEAEHPVFCGADDTAICSIVLEKLDHKLNNRKILYSIIRKDGAVLTWIKPDLRLLLLNPVAYFWLKYFDRLAMPQIDYWGWISFDDAEPSITANAVAYLGENEKTIPAINYLIRAWRNDRAENFMYYEKKIIFAYHIARAYKEGCKSLGVLKESIVSYIESESGNFVFAELLMAYLSLSYFEEVSPLILNLKSRIIAEIELRDAFADNYPYITAKNRVYYGGAGALTAAWFIEASADW